MNFRLLFQTHISAVVAAVIVGIVMVAPQVVFMSRLGSEYKGIYMLTADAETHYLARMEELYEGHIWGNPFLAEFKDKKYSPVFTPVEPLLAVPGYVLGVGVADLNLFYKFFFPAVIFVLAYALVWMMIRDKWAGIASGALITLGYNVMTAAGWVHLLRWDYVYTQFALYSRPISPEVSTLIFFGFLIAAYHLWGHPTRFSAAIALVLFGISFYAYLFLWIFIAALLGIFLIALINDDRFRYFMAVLGGGFVIGSPVLIFMAQASQSPFYGPLSLLLGVMHNRSWHVGFLSILVCMILASLVLKKYLDRKLALFLALLIVTTIGVLVQNIVTNIKIQEGHFHWYFNIPAYAVIISISIALWFREKPLLKNFVLGVLIIAAFCSNWLVQASSYKANYEHYAKIQDAREAFDWLNTHSRPDSVVLSNELLSELLPIYTHNNVFWNPYAAFYLLPLDSVESRLKTYLALEGYTCNSKNDLEKISLTNQDIKAFVGVGVINIYPDDVCARMKTLKNTPELDYILVDTRQDHWKIAATAQVVYNQEPYRIYKTQ